MCRTKGISYDHDDAYLSRYAHVGGRTDEDYVGPWLPEPVVDTAALAPDSGTELAEDLSIALLLILDQLSPLERAAFLQHEVFDFSFSEVATALERSGDACRKLATRVRAHVRALRPRGKLRRRCVRARSMRSMRSSCPDSPLQSSRAISMR